LRDDYITDSQRGLDRWNKVIEQHSIDYTFTLPHRGFCRQIGAFVDVCVSPEGKIVSKEVWADQVSDWLPTESDHEFVTSLMQPVTAPGAMATWIAQPLRGINGQPTDCSYVGFPSN